MLTRPRSSPRWPGVVTGLGLGLGSGCGNDNACDPQDFDPPPEPEPSPSGPPEVIAGEWIGSGVLELSFSQPLSSVGDLDPSRFAIVGWQAGGWTEGTQCDPWTRYYELAVGYYGQTGLDAVWIGPEDDTRLRLRLASTSAQCRMSGDVLGSGVMLAYTNLEHDAAGEPLRDADGDPIADLGPAWAVGDLDERIETCGDSAYCGRVYEFASEHLPEIDSLVPIPCP